MTAPRATSPEESETVVLSASAEDAGQRLDAFLAAQVEGWSRSRLHRLIEDGDVLVNGKAAKPSYKLRADDEIEADLTTLPLATFIPEEISIDVVYEDDDLLVVNKPAGMVVHPAAGVASGTLANALAFHFQKLSQTAGDARPGIVHRLDKDTSGLMVVAKTEIAHEKLADQFRDREVFKSYLALVHGSMEKDADQIDQPIARDPRHRTRMAVVRTGRSALTLYRVRQNLERFTLLDVELKTGRTHQIRVHLASLKHPVVADELYGGGRENSIRDVQLRARIRKLKRQFLHAQQLGFRHPQTGDPMKFVAPLPTELTQFLESLEGAQG